MGQSVERRILLPFEPGCSAMACQARVPCETGMAVPSGSRFEPYCSHKHMETLGKLVGQQDRRQRSEPGGSLPKITSFLSV